MPKLKSIRDAKSGREVLIDPNEIALVSFEWTGRQDYGEYLYSSSFVMKSGYTIDLLIKNGVKAELEVFFNANV